MNREQKAQIVAELKETLSECDSGIFTSYKGLSNAELMALRNKLRQLGIEYRVVKNTLARFAVEEAGKNFLADSFNGPVAIAFCHDEITQPAKTLTSYIDSSDTALSISGGFLGDRLLSREDVKSLASIPPREVLIAQVLAGMQAPITGLVNCLANPLRDFNGILQARIKQLEEN